MSSNMFTKVILDYIWIDANGEFRTKTRVINSSIQSNNIRQGEHIKIDKWTFNGKLTGDGHNTTIENSEVELIPIKIYQRYNVYSTDNKVKTEYFYVLCEKVYKTQDGDICDDIISNRKKLNMLIGKNDPYVFYIGCKQEFYMYPRVSSSVDVGGGSGKVGLNNSPFYCSINNFNQMERTIMDEFVKEAIDISPSLKISGFNQVGHRQWKFQVGPSEIMDGCDDLIMARFLMSKIANKYGYNITFHPKPNIYKDSKDSKDSNYNNYYDESIPGSACHINISTHKMRIEPSGEDGTNGIHHIMSYLDFLKDYHKDMIMVSGNDNTKRLNGYDETPSLYKYSYKIGSRKVSCRIPINVKQDKYGYFEDRRPGANVDPYEYMYKHYMCYMRFVDCGM